jgi:aldehyde dehydrogenase (NAD+)
VIESPSHSVHPDVRCIDVVVRKRKGRTVSEPRDLIDSYDLYIDGRWLEPQAGRFTDFSPYSELPIGTAPDSSEQQMGEAIAAARRAADDGRWSALLPEERANCLQQLGTALLEHRPQIAALARAEWACTPATDLLQIDGPTFMAMRAADLASTPQEYEQETFGSGGRTLIRHEPIGVVAIITPWNFPHTINTMKVCTALAAGNCIILKPSPLTPMAGFALAALIDNFTDIPPGVLNVVTTSSLAASEYLVRDPRVDMVSFTGSTSVGRTIMANAAGTMKRLLLELGGKSAQIFLDRESLEGRLDRVLFDSCTMHSGQACILNSRLLVPRSSVDEVSRMLGDLAREVVIGDPSDPNTQMGPLISADQRARVEAHVATAVADGARLVAGGQRPADQQTGYFFEPTILDRVDPASRIAQEEVFGPVLCIMGFDDAEHAVEIANDSPYGLSGAVWGTDASEAIDVARRIRTGQISVNGSIPGDAPYGGFKQSGIGRDGGVTGLRSYTETKAIGVPV